MTTISAELATTERRRTALLSPGTLGIAAATGLVLFEAVDALLGSHGLGATLPAGWAQLVAPAFVVLVLAAVVCERLWPAERRPVPRPRPRPGCVLLPPLRPGHRAVHDAAQRRQRRHPARPRHAGCRRRGRRSGPVGPWSSSRCVAMDLCNWLAHWGDHRIGVLWRIHALHHSQEELSVLTSFRAHPLMHTTGFVLATVPVLVTHRRPPAGARSSSPSTSASAPCRTPTSAGPTVHSAASCVSPAYHRQHHAVEGQQDVNLGVVLTVWDVLAGRARFRLEGAAPCAHRPGRPAGARRAGRGAAGRTAPARLLARQLAQPFSDCVKRPAASAAEAARRQQAAAGHEGQRLRRARTSAPEPRGPVQVVRPQLHVAEVDPEQVGRVRPPPRSRAPAAMHASGTRRGQRHGLGDVELVDDAVRQRALARRHRAAATRATPGSGGRPGAWRRAARRRGPPPCRKRVKSPPAASSSAMKAGPS